MRGYAFKIIGAISATIYLLFVLLSLFVLPNIIEEQATEALSDALGRDVGIEKVSLNPFMLSATVEGFSVNDEQTQELLGFDALYVNFQLSSLFRRQWHFDEVALSGLRAHVQRNPEFVFNFDDVLAHVNAQAAEQAEVLPSSENEQEAAIAEAQASGVSAPPPLDELSGADEGESEASIVEGNTVAASDDATAAETASDPVDSVDAAAALVEPQPEEPESALPPISVALFSLENGALTYTEAAGKTPHTVTFPLSFTVENFSTVASEAQQNDYAIRLQGPDGGAFDWQGNFDVSPFAARGRVEVTGVDLTSLGRLLEESLRFEVPSGELDVKAHYTVQQSPVFSVQLSDGALALRDLAIHKPEHDEAAVRVPALRVEKVMLDSATRDLQIGNVAITEAKVRAALEQNGLDLASLFLAVDPEAAERQREKVKEKAADVAERIAEGETFWTVRIQNWDIAKAQLHFTDQTLAAQPTLQLTDIQVTGHDLAVGEAGTFGWKTTARFQDSGSLALEGDGSVETLSMQAKINAEAIPLVALSPWLEEASPLKVNDGQLALSAQVSFDEPQGVVATGNATLRQLDLREGSQPLLRLAQGDVNGVALDVAKSRLAIDRVLLTNLDSIHRIDAAGASVSTRVATTTDSSASSAAATPWRVSLNRLSLKNAQLRHEDASVTPNFKIGLYQLDGEVRDISTVSGQAATVALAAKVDRYAPFEVTGSVVPEPLKTDLAISLQGYDMTSLTPFTGYYLGYAVERGRLDVSTTVDIEDNHLNSFSKVFTDHFYLGEKVASEEALKVPVKLGLSVLRNRSGEMHLPVKMRGELDDPNFSVSGMILKVIGNIVVKASTAPFSMLASLGGGPDLEYLPFSPASSEVNDETRQALDALAALLLDRPHLQVGLVGRSGENDRRAFAESALVSALDEESWPGIEAASQDQAWRETIVDYYLKSRTDEQKDAQSMPEDEQGLSATQVQALWETLLNEFAQNVTDEQLLALAQQRTDQARAYLIDEKTIVPERLLVKAPIQDSEQSGISLTLEQ